MDGQFGKEKASRLAATDLSKKGSIDDPIVSLIAWINGNDQLFSTSSCSGRVICYETSGGGKPGCRFLRVFHSLLNGDDVEDLCDAVEESVRVSVNGSKIVFKYEPFILHARVKELHVAEILCKTAIECGFRNSGVTFGKNGRILVAVRNSHGLEVPLSSHGTLRVPREYIRFLCEEGNSRLAENFARIMKFEHHVKNAKLKIPDPAEMSTLRCRRHPASLDLSEGDGKSFSEKNCQEDAEFLDLVETLFPKD